MRGKHQVKTFELDLDEILDLPEGYKPFAVFESYKPNKLVVVTRKWERSE